MKRIIGILIVFISILFIGDIKAYNVDLYLFHSSTCPHCKEERKYLKTLEKKYSYLNIHYYEQKIHLPYLWLCPRRHRGSGALPAMQTDR